MMGKRDRTGRTRRVGLLAGAVALLLQILAWAWMPAWVSAANAAETGRIVVCTPDGFKTVAPDGAETHADPGNGHTETTASGDSCPLCPLIGGLAPPPPVAAVAPAAYGRHGPEGLPGVRIAAGWFLSSLQARAPPAIG